MLASPSLLLPLSDSPPGQDNGLKEAVGHFAGAWCPECAEDVATAEAASRFSNLYNQLNWEFP